MRLRPYLEDDHISRTRRSQVGFRSSPLISRIFFLSFKLSQKNYPNETLYVESIKHFVSTSSYIPLSYDWRTEIVRLVNDVKDSLAFIRSVVFLLASIFPQLNTKHNWLMSLCWFDLIDSSAWRRSSSVKIEQEVWIPSWFQPGSWLHFVVSESSFMRMIKAQISLHWSYVQQREVILVKSYETNWMPSHAHWGIQNTWSLAEQV